jgi:hypothetical protein
LNEPYLHYNFAHGLAAWFAKHIRYAQDEAALAALRTGAGQPRLCEFFTGSTHRRLLAKSLAGYVPWLLRPPLRFLYIFVLRQGFRDGLAGLAYAVMMAVYEGMIAVFCYEQLLRAKPLKHSYDVPSRPVEHSGVATANSTDKRRE